MLQPIREFLQVYFTARRHSRFRQSASCRRPPTPPRPRTPDDAPRPCLCLPPPCVPLSFLLPVHRFCLFSPFTPVIPVCECRCRRRATAHAYYLRTTRRIIRCRRCSPLQALSAARLHAAASACRCYASSSPPRRCRHPCLPPPSTPPRFIERLRRHIAFSMSAAFRPPRQVP